MEEKAKILSISIEPNSNRAKVILLFNNRGIVKFLEKYKDVDLRIIIKKWFNKRSLNANSYAWSLITELANAMKISKEEMYFLKLKDYGQSQLVLITEKANPKYYFKYYSKEGTTIVKGQKYIWYKVYKGTSEYDTKEMSIFIDGLVQECVEQNIEIKSEKEVKALLESWDKK